MTLNWTNTVSQEYDYTLGERGIWHVGSYKNEDTLVARKNGIHYRIDKVSDGYHLRIKKKICMDVLNPEFIITLNEGNTDFNALEEAKSFAASWYVASESDPSIIEDEINKARNEFNRKYKINSIKEANQETFIRGKFNGRKLEEVWSKDKKYCLWYLANVNRTHENRRIQDSIEMLLKKEITEEEGPLDDIDVIHRVQGTLMNYMKY